MGLMGGLAGGCGPAGPYLSPFSSSCFKRIFRMYARWLSENGRTIRLNCSGFIVLYIAAAAATASAAAARLMNRIANGPRAMAIKGDAPMFVRSSRWLQENRVGLKTEDRRGQMGVVQ